jgi:hypothetical protein
VFKKLGLFNLGDSVPPGPNWPSLGAVRSPSMFALSCWGLGLMRPDTMLDLCGVLSLSFEEMGLVHDGKGMPKG